MITETKTTISFEGINNIIKVYYQKYPTEAYGTTHVPAEFDYTTNRWSVKFYRSRNAD